ncbi:unnamed protein product [Prorocentrum cordatum]|uniref:Uncharacterized protein n=1 Tax=Prorocentrum cordatum TaxID=2364126 RepID=A0ABN9W228_9DINO|nr:unnamed protein product [Polarella glacialis]
MPPVVANGWGLGCRLVDRKLGVLRMRAPDPEDACGPARRGPAPAEAAAPAAAETPPPRRPAQGSAAAAAAGRPGGPGSATAAQGLPGPTPAEEAAPRGAGVEPARAPLGEAAGESRSWAGAPSLMLRALGSRGGACEEHGDAAEVTPPAAPRSPSRAVFRSGARSYTVLGSRG